MAEIDPRDQLIAEQGRRIAELEALVARLVAEVTELKAKVAENSRNSSRPPSSDGPGASPRTQTPTGRRPGGQPGHKGNKRDLLPVGEVNEVVTLKPERCRGCARPLKGTDPAPWRHQVTDVPVPRPVVTEYQCHELTCTGCGAATRAELPRGVPRGAFGPALMSLIGLLTGRYRLSKREAQDLVSDVTGVEMALGSICRVERQVSEAVAPAVEEARQFVRQQPWAHQDETGWREALKRAWLWVAVTGCVTVFLIDRSRGSVVSKAMLGDAFRGFVITDRWSGYSWLPVARRQLCWSHLERDVQGFIDRGGESARVGARLMGEISTMFGWWHRARDGTLDRPSFQRWMGLLAKRVGHLLREAAVCADSKTAGVAREVLKLEPALWTFVHHDVDPTNNSAERAIRPAVLWRKGSFGTHSANGSRFVERMLTVSATLRQQNRHVLGFLATSVRAHLFGETGPSLIPPTAQTAALAA